MPVATRRQGYTATQSRELVEKSPLLSFTQAARVAGCGIESVAKQVNDGTWDLTPLVTIGERKRIPGALLLRALGIEPVPPKPPDSDEDAETSEAIQRLIDRAPDLSAERRAQLSALFSGAV